MAKKKLLEYIYIDEVRLDSYIQQFSSLEKKEISFLKKLKIGLTSFGIEINQSNNIRNYSTHEKVLKFENYLKKSNQIFNGRPTNHERWNNDIVFVKEITEAQKIILPFSNEQNSGLGIWVSENELDFEIGNKNNKSSLLFLIEDFKGEDKDPINISGYSALSLFLKEFKFELMKTILGNEIIISLENKNFLRNPINDLRNAGAKFLDKRKIATIYRIRASCNDNLNGFEVTYFGYPIFIAELL